MNKYTYAGKSDIGKMRSANQDRILLCPEQNFFAVSDGMGGLTYGEESANYVRDTLPELLENHNGKREDQPIEDQLKNAVQELSEGLFRKGNTDEDFQYGATLAGVRLYKDYAFFVGLGDSRGYLLRGDVLTQVTEDMNIAALMIRHGMMTKEEALHSPASARLTAFVGMEPPAEPAVWPAQLQPGDMILLCSDGLYGMVGEDEIIKILKSDSDLENLCQKLIDQANQNGGKDNIAVVLIFLEAENSEQDA